ncbi:MAG: T9SS sorting signal type C domain-containing protein [Bacteroidota bacterium]
MKNNLLKISALVALLTVGCYFVYQNGFLQKPNSESHTIKTHTTTNKENLVESVVLETEKKATELVETPTKQILKKQEIASSSSEIQSNEQNSSSLSKSESDSIEKIREKYHNFVNHHSFRKLMKLPKKERKAMGLPPNAFFEQDFLYSSDPNLGRPTPEVTLALQKDLNEKLESGRVPGDGMDNQWVERGANNVGGRTRVLKFAPGSTTKVFAGAVSGGLWVNNDITATAGSWTQVSGVPSNMAVTCMTIDPLNTNIMYIGTGEVYTGGMVNGNGVYKSIDGGVTWRLIFGGTTNTIADQITFIQDIIAWVNPTTGLTEVYFGADAYVYGEEINSASGGANWSWLGLNTIGLYKSTNGVDFVRQTNASLQSGSYFAPNSFDTNSAGNLIMGTKNNAYGAGGGRLFSCANGTTWTQIRDFGTAGRVQVAASKTTAGRMYVLLENTANGLPVIRRSTDGFVTDNTNMPLPTSSGNQPPAADDFCRGQAFYDLMIGMNPTNDSEVYVGGIEIFRNTQAFTAAPVTGDWVQYTDWTINPTVNGNTGTLRDGVHSDHHCMAFAPGLTTRVVFGNDGGVYYSNDSANSIGVRNNNYNVTQPYKADINTATTATTRIIAGLQDNGSQYVNGAAAGINSFTRIGGGDGCWEFIEDTDAYAITSYVYNVYYRHAINGGYTYTIANNQNEGDFVNQCGLDSANDKLYANGSSGGNYRVYRYDIGPASATRTDFTNALVNDIPTFFKSMPTTTTTLLVGLANGRIIKMVDAATAANSAGVTWSNIASASMLGAVSDIRFGATENDIFVTFHNYGVTNIWYTSNGGTSWTSKDGDLPNLPVKCILQNPNATNEVIIGTELGVWYTVNFNVASPTWRRANNGMKDVKVMNFEFRALDNTIVAATYGRGVWTGQFWQCGATTKTWNGTAWSPVGTPTYRDAVVFAGNYTSTATLDACSVTVNAGAAVTFVSGHSLRVGENVTVNATGSLTINSGAALVQYTKHAVNTGSIIVRRSSTNMVHNDYTAWSSPVVGQNLLNFSPNTLTNRFYTYNTVNSGTSATAYTSVNPTTTSFALAKGYMIRVNNNWTLTPAVYNGQFTGVPNNGSVTFTTGIGYNLLGNPYASPISAYRLLITNPKLDALYYWTHTVAAVAGVFPQNNYASYTTLGGTAAAAGGAIPNDKINVGQGFFVKCATAAYPISFENELREDASTTTQFFRNPNAVAENVETEKHRIWLNLNDGTKSYNQILLGYTPNATGGIDHKVDGKMLDTSKTSLYNLIENSEYVIQGKGLPFSDEDVVKLGLKVTEASNFEINIEQVDGLFENQDVFVKDNYIGAIHNLKEGSYYFISQVGTFNDRFELIYKKPTKEIEVTSANSVDVLVKNNELIIQTYQSAIANVEVYDVLGKVVFTKNGINNKQFNTNQITATKQALIVKIQLENGEVVVKKIIM